jgi:two-component system NtrC family sensor kinase
VVDIIVSLDVLKADLASYRNRIILLTVLLIILLGASLTFFTLHLVNRPVNELLRHTARLANGQLDCELTPTSSDELGELMRAFQLMTNNLREARNDLKEWGRTLEEKVEERSEELKRMQMQLVHTEKLASLGELVAGIAHEINNPLSGILIFSSLVAKDKRLDPALKGDIETISGEAQRCAGIVKGLLEFARDYQPEMITCDINQVLVDSLRLVECQSVFQNVTIIRQLGNNLPDIMADQNQLKQVFINIFINAGQAMQELKQAELQIITTADETVGGGVVVKISDSGGGVPEEQLCKLFDPFFTTKGTGGTGLGLSVSYGIIQAHGGTITAKSTIDVGTTFIVSLPRCPSHDDRCSNEVELVS